MHHRSPLRCPDTTVAAVVAAVAAVVAVVDIGDSASGGDEGLVVTLEHENAVTVVVV